MQVEPCPPCAALPSTPVSRLLEGVAMDRELMQTDGIHPNADAQPLLLDNVWPVLVPLLEGRDAQPRSQPVRAAAGDSPQPRRVQ